MRAKDIVLITTFSALISASSITAHFVPWIGHPTVGSIVVTFLYLTAFGMRNKLGVATTIGLIVGIINSFVFGSILSIPIHCVRGGAYDLFFMVTRHRFCCKKCAILSSMLSYYATITMIFSLYTLFLLPLPPWTIWFVIVGIPSTLLTLPASLLALRYKPTFRRILGA